MSMRLMVIVSMIKINKKPGNNFSTLIKFYQLPPYFLPKFKKNHMVMKAKRTDNNRLRITDFKLKKMLKLHKALLQI